ncbi:MULTISPECIES: TetR/AcrR family transcriptional regulator [unclassified Pseudofrankia]|uniref:TetR/AcrR family transcriptional regulator n=1 Tax=unclassified Pseudofrankia TaxID=2994372 RepID=UPI0008DB218E|nr:MULTISPECIES: TetR family transcriptional regulator [unclassified Pseudofrankia]MDT3439933.1 TetR family transcriptional regulator [Pseudofrankia sp. BMG5.37]OHV48398.1 hypothetical protein BCD48_15565 [Pseudofrankia sp. BMG5.36]
MPKTAPRRRRQRGSIQPDDIVAGAFEIARETSLDQLSMPALAEHLDVGVTSLYWHFRKKEELLNRMTDVAAETYLAQLPPISGNQPWQDMLLEHFRNERKIYANDHLLADLLLVRTSTWTRDTARRLFQVIEAIVSRLVEAGFTTEDALLIHNAASVYTRGITLHDRILRLSNSPTLDIGQRRIMSDWSSMPLLDSQLDRHPLAGTTNEDFEFGMARLVCGFEALLAEKTGGTAAS